jgi:hypothetical protein
MLPRDDPAAPGHAQPAVAALRAELAAARAEAAALRERLDVAQEFGRLGTWEHDIASGHLAWDAATLRLADLAPDTPADTGWQPLLARLIEADRDRVARYLADSAGRLGPHAVRFRLCTRAGLERRLHAQWEVRPGPEGRPARMVGLLLDETDTLAPLGLPGEGESQLALAVEAADVLIWRHDLASGRVVWSPQGWRALGMVPRPEGLTLDEVRALIHPDDLPRVQASAQEALAGGRAVELEARYRHTDGQWRTQLLRRMVLRDAQGEAVAFLGVALDVTERRAEQRRAQAMAARFDTAMRAAGVGHWVNDIGSDRIEWSPQCRAMHGLRPDEPPPPARPWLEAFVHPDDRETVRHALQRLPSVGEQGLSLVLRIVRRDGQVRQLYSHTRMEQGPDGAIIFGVLIDTTERAEADLALRKAQERIALALRGAGIGTWEMDLQTRVTRWDEQMWRLRGREPRAESPSEQELWSWVHPDDRERSLQSLRTSEAAAAPMDNEFRVQRPDGSVRWLASRSAEVQDADGRRLRIGVNWDVTAARTAEAARREGELARRESQAKSQFLARMSHELRTPLNAVLGFAQLMLADEDGDGAESAGRRHRLDHIHAAGRHLLDLIDDVLTLSGVEGGELPVAAEPVALAALLGQVLPMLQPLCEAQGVQVAVDVAPGLCVRADAIRLRQVLLNLLGNAVKYNRPQGRVQVSAERAGTRVNLRIADTGHGLDAQQLRHLFEPFNRLGAERSGVQGTGIGLAIVKALVERMQGTMAVHSRPGEGSVFTVDLPLAEAVPGDEPAAAAADRPAPQAAGAAAHEGGHHRLLYIEDNPVNALIIRELVARRGDLELEVAPDGLSGVARARERPPGLVLLDMQLPDIDGLEVLRRLRAEPATAGIPVIALSANAMPEDIDRALAAGCSGYWTKPLDFRAFMAGLETLFGAPPPA